MTDIRLQLHHIIPREAIAQMAEVYARRFEFLLSPLARRVEEAGRER